MRREEGGREARTRGRRGNMLFHVLEWTQLVGVVATMVDDAFDSSISDQYQIG